MTSEKPFRDLVTFARGGGWGSESPQEGHELVAIIRGTDFDAVRSGQLGGVPRRWEKGTKLPQRLLKANDIVLEISGGSSAKGQSTGRSIFISNSILDGFEIPVIPASFCRIVRVDGDIVFPRYAYYGLQDMYKSRRAAEYENQSTGISNFQFERFLDAEYLRLPPMFEQQAIAAVLGALDDKIALNERIASGADELRRNLFDQYIAEASTAIRSVPLSSTADFINGRAFTKEATGTGRMVIRIAEINSGPSGSTVYNDIDVPDQHLARPGDVLFAWSGSLTVARWFRPEAIINQHIFKVVPKSGIPTWLAFELTRSKLDEFKGIAADKATTMGHIQRRHLDEPVSMPAVEDLPRLDAELGPLWARALVAEQENLALAQLRDTLLPKLMSGELRVRDAEKMVEDAT